MNERRVVNICPSRYTAAPQRRQAASESRLHPVELRILLADHVCARPWCHRLRLMLDYDLLLLLRWLVLVSTNAEDAQQADLKLQQGQKSVGKHIE